MRKINVLVGILLVALGLLTNHMYEFDKDVEASDYDIAMMHAQRVYDDDIYEYIVICDDTNDEMIHYQCYDGEQLISDNSIYRDFSYDCLTGYYDDIQD